MGLGINPNPPPVRLILMDCDIYKSIVVWNVILNGSFDGLFNTKVI